MLRFLFQSYFLCSLKVEHRKPTNSCLKKNRACKVKIGAQKGYIILGLPNPVEPGSLAQIPQLRQDRDANRTCKNIVHYLYSS